MRIKTLVTAIVSIICITSAYAEVIELKNGDRLTGTLVKATSTTVSIKHPSLGTIIIPKSDIAPASWSKVEPGYQEALKQTKAENNRWKGSVEMGSSFSDGNTDKSSLYGNIHLKRDFGYKLINAKFETFRSSTDGNQEEEKWNALLEQINNLGDSKWFTSYRITADHDRFANIDYRIIPALGVGYHLVQKDNLKLDVRTSVAYQTTHYRDDTFTDDEIILIPGAHFETNVFEKSQVIFDIDIFPSLESGEGYRAKAELAFITPISDKLSFKISALDEYDSEPSENTFKNDVKVLTSLVYQI